MTAQGAPPRARDIPDAVLWHEGLLLGPQHFQLTTHRMEQLLAYLVAATAPFRWGLSRLRCSPTRLAEGVFEIEELEGVMPDGLIVRSAADDGSPLALDLAAQSKGLGEPPWTVHLAVLSIANQAPEQVGEDVGRYQGYSLSMIERDGAAESPVLVPLRRPALALLLSTHGATLPFRYVSLPIAKIGIEDSAHVALPFVPPHLTVGAFPILQQLLDGLIGQLRAKATDLSEAIVRQGDGGLSLPGLQLRAMVTALPKLEAMINHGVSHPFDFYLAFAEAIGSLSGIGDLQAPAKLPDYDHANPLPVFQELVDRAKGLIDQLEVRFEKHEFKAEDGCFRLRLKESWLSDALLIQLHSESRQSIFLVEQWARRALIGSADRIPQIREARANGAEREVIQRDNQTGLASGADTVLVRVKLYSPASVMGLQLDGGKTIEIQGEIPQDESGRPTKIFLIVPKPPAQIEDA